MRQAATLNLDPVSVVSRGRHGSVLKRAFQKRVFPACCHGVHLDAEQGRSDPLHIRHKLSLQICRQGINHANQSRKILPRGMQLVDERNHDAQARLI